MMLEWILFNAAILVLLALDLYSFKRKAHVIKMREALWTSAFWIALALVFNHYIYLSRGEEAGINFLTGYLIEKSLSVDNLFVFVLIFSFFKVSDKLQHKVLFWGILGAIVMRAVFILFGIALLERFHWIIYLFGIFLIYTGIKLGFEKDKEIEPETNYVIKMFQRFMPVTHEYHGDKFFIKKGLQTFATPLCVALVTIESTDLIFALDSIPAILGITSDPFIAYTSNILAILGLRSLYFVLAHVIKLFVYLHYGLAFILVFIGVKMLISGYVEIPVLLSLGVVVSALAVTVLASLYYPPKN